jgi:hypothetical protein
MNLSPSQVTLYSKVTLFQQGGGLSGIQGLIIIRMAAAQLCRARPTNSGGTSEVEDRREYVETAVHQQIVPLAVRASRHANSAMKPHSQAARQLTDTAGQSPNRPESWNW